MPFFVNISAIFYLCTCLGFLLLAITTLCNKIRTLFRFCSKKAALNVTEKTSNRLYLYFAAAYILDRMDLLEIICILYLLKLSAGNG